jgi:hypothetical protein
MNMHDNELDNLFRSKLDGLEVEPSAQVWENISAELNSSKKRTLSPVWSIAASLTLLIGAGAWFFTNGPDKVQQNQVAVEKTNAVTPGKLSEPTDKPVIETDSKPLMEKSDISIQRINTIAKVKHAVTSNNKGLLPSTIVKSEPVLLAKQKEDPSVSVSAPVLAAVPDKQVMQAVVPEMRLAASALPSTDETVNKTAVAQVPDAAMARQPERKKKRGIHTLGGLINVVIAKVDKREDKVIEFTETDDDQANITVINLGLFKVKKEK